MLFLYFQIVTTFLLSKEMVCPELNFNFKSRKNYDFILENKMEYLIEKLGCPTPLGNSASCTKVKLNVQFLLDEKFIIKFNCGNVSDQLTGAFKTIEVSKCMDELDNNKNKKNPVNCKKLIKHMVQPISWKSQNI